MTTFALRGHPGPLFYGSHSSRPLTIKGSFHAQGLQPIGHDGIPQWAVNLFDSMPHLTQLAVNSASGGIVWSRVQDEDAGATEPVKEETTVTIQPPASEQEIVELVDRYADAFAALKTGEEDTLAGAIVAGGIKEQLMEKVRKLCLSRTAS